MKSKAIIIIFILLLVAIPTVLFGADPKASSSLELKADEMRVEGKVTDLKVVPLLI